MELQSRRLASPRSTLQYSYVFSTTLHICHVFHTTLPNLHVFFTTLQNCYVFYTTLHILSVIVTTFYIITKINYVKIGNRDNKVNLFSWSDRSVCAALMLCHMANIVATINCIISSFCLAPIIFLPEWIVLFL